MKSTQELFDTVVEHLMTQKRRAVNSSQECVYRAPNGLKCAIGCLIPDEKYKPEFEGEPFYIILPLIEELAPLAVDEYDSLGDRLQRIHDIGEVENWAELLLNTALVYDLDPSLAMAYCLYEWGSQRQKHSTR